MNTSTKIQWTDVTLSPWWGCTKVSSGCANCYAENHNKRFFAGVNWGKGAPRKRNEHFRSQALLLDARTKSQNRTCRIFPSGTCRVFPSQCDPFDEEVPGEWIEHLLEVIVETPCLEWQLLTKRPQNIVPMLQLIAKSSSSSRAGQCAAAWLEFDSPSNVHLGISAEDQKNWKERSLAAINVPIGLMGHPLNGRFVSFEPLLGPIKIEYGELSGFDWIIIGGESIGLRPCAHDWIRLLVEAGRANEVPVFVKQLGSHSIQGDPNAEHVRFKTKDRKGGNIDEFPEDLRVRELP